MDKTLKQNSFEGIVYLTHNGKPVYSSVTGTDEKGKKLTLNSSMYIGSVSKQFCAAAVMMLKQKGKLNVNDTIDKFFPKYTQGKKITIKNLLTMRSGLPKNIAEDKYKIAPEQTEAQNTDSILKTIFNLTLSCKPDTKYEYSNTNYILLANIVEKASGKKYIDFIRTNIFKPLGMTHSGFVDEVRDNPKWAKGLTYDTFTTVENCKGMTKGAGDVVANAADMDKWMTALQSGELISKKTYKEMTKDYSPDYAEQYGYGLILGPLGGVGHSGNIGTYYARDFFIEKEGYNLFIASRKAKAQYENLPSALLKSLI